MNISEIRGRSNSRFQAWWSGALFASLLAVAPATASASAAVQASRIDHRGWGDSIRLSNGQVETIVVPAIGRIMHFGPVNGENVFWENPALYGKTFDGRTKGWINFGGDKTWPSPEADWGNFTGKKEWDPPLAFDGQPHTSRIDNDTVILVSPVDPQYGLQVTRRIRLMATKPVLEVTTVYERVSGEPAPMGIWIITQLKEPAGLYMPVPENSRFEGGYYPLIKTVPPSLKQRDFGAGRQWLSLIRDSKTSHKIGGDAGTLIWVGDKFAVRIDSPRVPGAEYPDHGSSAEIYTNGGDLKYIELEMLGPLHQMKPGDKLEQKNVYTLYPRTQADPQQEARNILGW